MVSPRADPSRVAGRPRSWSAARVAVLLWLSRGFLGDRGRFRSREPWELFLRQGGPLRWPFSEEPAQLLAARERRPN
eukprot:924523-Heterocapsa_arctica.AAC.1